MQQKRRGQLRHKSCVGRDESSEAGEWRVKWQQQADGGDMTVLVKTSFRLCMGDHVREEAESLQTQDGAVDACSRAKRSSPSSCCWVMLAGFAIARDLIVKPGGRTVTLRLMELCRTAFGVGRDAAAIWGRRGRCETLVVCDVPCRMHMYTTWPPNAVTMLILLLLD
ncbi:hypothetical protein L1887_57246 [Cichorium endivia]|nr:hypothetical protein L1887_57246 [Cichorium endivia]